MYTTAAACNTAPVCATVLASSTAFVYTVAPLRTTSAAVCNIAPVYTTMHACTTATVYTAAN
eukprot:336153-Pyramimonas_sp.AAC.1